MANSSISISSSLMRASSRKTWSAALRSFWATAATLRWTDASTSALISSSLPFSCSSSCSKWRTILAPVCIGKTSTESACNVVFGFFLGGVLEDNRGVIEFDQLSHQEKPGVIGYARGLLHVVRDDHDGATVLELENQVLDFRGCDGVQRR